MAKMKRKLKKILSLVLVLSLCMSMMGMTAFAQGDENPCEHDFVVNFGRIYRHLCAVRYGSFPIAVNAGKNRCGQM